MTAELDPRRRDAMLAAGAPYAHRPIRAAWHLLTASGLLATQPRLAALVDAHLETGRPSILREIDPDREPALVAWIGYPAWAAIGQALADDDAGHGTLFDRRPEYEDHALLQLAAALTGHYPVTDLLSVTGAAVWGDPSRAALVAQALLIATGTDHDLEITRTT